jgi:hypothetical protein
MIQLSLSQEEFDPKKYPRKNAIRHLMGQFREILDGPSITSESAHD